LSAHPHVGRKFMLIDGHSLLHRAFYALPTMTSSTGEHTNAVYGFATMLMKVLSDEQPDYIVVAFDKETPTFRHEQYADYKAHRPKMADELRSQIPLVKELVQAFNISICELDGYEADDIIGTLAKQAETENLFTVIVTGDKDALQLVSPDVQVLITLRGISNMDRYDEKMVKQKIGITPPQVVDLKALMGDKSDNIPGVVGIGEKTALNLLATYETVDNVLAHADEIAGKVGERIRTHADDARLSWQLARIDTNVPIKVDWPEFQLQKPDAHSLAQLCTKLEMRGLLTQIHKRYHADVQAVAQQALLPVDDVRPLQLQQVQRESWQTAIDNLSDPLTVLAAFDEKDAQHLRPVMVSVAGGEQMVYADGGCFDLYCRLLQGTRPLRSHDLKTQLVAVGQRSDDISANVKQVDDLMLMSYLCHPEQGDHSLADLAIKCGIGVLPPMDAAAPDPASLAIRHQVLQAAAPALTTKLKENDLQKLYCEVELPLTRVLARMELAGITIDPECLATMSQEMANDIKRLTESIYELANEKFNINSPKQLAEVLFNKLGLPVKKSTKTGPSTSADVLEELAMEHEVAQQVIDYRQLMKLKGTYVDALPALINKSTGRLHTTFNQAVTATGRLSSTNPNLQNIPVRTALGRQIRRAFLPGKPDWMLLSADYSQIELRVLAHLSGDENLITAFRAGADIHTKTASEVFEVDPEKVTSEMRSAAKAINFGIVYGISSFGLAKGTGLTRQAAQSYIDNYFRRYAGVKRYMEETVAIARSQGYVTTVLGRRRYLPDLHSRKWPQRSFAERTAMNTPIQGSAADIIKLAMLRVESKLNEAGLHSQMLLQVHDELVLEVPQSELMATAKIVRTAMEGAYELVVPLSVSIGAGPNWLDIKELKDA
jgi:DNA polymerase-1